MLVNVRNIEGEICYSGRLLRADDPRAWIDSPSFYPVTRPSQQEVNEHVARCRSETPGFLDRVPVLRAGTDAAVSWAELRHIEPDECALPDCPYCGSMFGVFYVGHASGLLLFQCRTQHCPVRGSFSWNVFEQRVIDPRTE